MKKIVPFLVFLFFPLVSNAQYGDHLSVYFGGGYGFLLSSSTGITKFVDRYNFTRKAVISKQMETPGMMSGFSFQTGMKGMGLMFELGITSGSSKMTSEADPSKVAPGSATSREIDLKFKGYNLTFGFQFGDHGVAVGPVMDVSIINLSFETKTNISGAVGDDIGTNVGIGAGLQIVLGDMEERSFEIVIKPSYIFSLFGPDFEPLYRRTGTTPEEKDYLPDTKGGFGGFQLNIGINVGFNCI